MGMVFWFQQCPSQNAYCILGMVRFPGFAWSVACICFVKICVCGRILFCGVGIILFFSWVCSRSSRGARKSVATALVQVQVSLPAGFLSPEGPCFYEVHIPRVSILPLGTCLEVCVSADLGGLCNF